MEAPTMHSTHQTAALAELLVAHRFLEAGYPVAWPLFPRPYDLLVETTERGIVRVQVKHAHEAPDASWHVRLKRRVPGGQDLPIAAAGFDYLVVVCKPDRCYVLPVAICTAPHAPTRLLTRLRIYTGPQARRFTAFVNRFTLDGGATPTYIPLGAPKRRMWRTSEIRKPYTRLPRDVVEEVLRLPVAWNVREAHSQLGALTPAAAAAQFGISVATLRNLWQRRRQDLRQAPQS